MTCWRCSTTSGPAAPTSPSAAGVRSPAASGRGTRALGNNLVVWWLRRRIGMTAHDIAPMRVCRRETLLGLDVQDRRFGYPVELLQKATVAGWRFSERDVAYHPRAARHPLEGLRLGAWDRPGGPRLLAGARVRPSMLVVAKAPEAGRVKTRLGAADRDGARRRSRGGSAAGHSVRCSGRRRAPGTATCRSAATSTRPYAADELRAALAGWTVHPQQGVGLGARLADAHARVPGPVVQVGMDTPHLTPDLLLAAASELADHDAVLGPAEDGGWWVLALRDPARASVLRDVPMSTPTTYADTRQALRRDGLRVSATETLRDIDTAADAEAVAQGAGPAQHFSRVWAAVAR